MSFNQGRRRTGRNDARIACFRGDNATSAGKIDTTSHGGKLSARERIVAKAGFNRWLAPPAALAIHLCIGMAYGFSVFSAALVTFGWNATGTKVSACAGAAATFWDKTLGTLTALTATNCEWTQFELVNVHALFRFARLVGPDLGALARQRRPRKAGVYAALCWCSGLMISAIGVKTIEAADALRSARRDRRDRAWPWLYFAGINARQMVPRPARHGDRHGDHGIRRRRDDRLASRQSTHEPFQDSGFGRRVGNLRRSCAWLFRLHDCRRFRLPRAARRLEAGGLDAACHANGHDHGQSCRSETRAQDTAILANLGGPVSQRFRGYRDHRRGIADVAGDIRRALFRDSSIGFTQFSDAQKTLAAEIGGRFIGLFSLFNIGGRFFLGNARFRIGRKTTYIAFFVLGVICYASARRSRA